MTPLHDIAKKIIDLQSEKPLASIVIPAYNEEKYLFKTIEALSKLETSIPLEIILVDNNSNDTTREIAESFGLKVIEEKHKWTSYARQAGLMAAKGKYIFTTDADTIVPPTWIEKSMNYFHNNRSLTFLSGGLKFHWAHWLFYIAKSVPILYWKIRRKNHLSFFLVGANSVFLREAALKAGGYEAGINMGEDILLAQKMSRNGGEVLGINDPEIVVTTNGRRFSTPGRVIKYILEWKPRWTLEESKKFIEKRFQDIR